jgi:hypothetical protein
MRVLKMKVSSATATSFDSIDAVSEVPHADTLPQVWQGVKRFFRRLDQTFTAIACAEAGDLDAVKAILKTGKAQPAELGAAAKTSAVIDCPGGSW